MTTSTTRSIASPNFLCIGAAKAGTTTLYHVLQRHPQVFVTTPKELNFFSRPDRYALGWDWYANHFRPAKPEQIARGEFGVTYAMVTKWVGTVERMQAHLPHVKLIYMVRDPVQRIESAWLENRLGRNRDSSTFAEAVRRPNMIDCSRYWIQYQAYAQAYGEASIHVIFLEDYRRDPASELRSVCQFLEINPDVDWGNLDERFNTSDAKREDHRLLSWLRRAPGFRHIRDKLPNVVRGGFKALFKNEQVKKPRWRAADYEYVVEQLRGDTATFLGQMNKPSDFWTLAPTFGCDD